MFHAQCLRLERSDIYCRRPLEDDCNQLAEPFMPQIYHIKLFTPSIKSNRFPCVNFAPIKARSRLTQILQAWEKEQFQKIQKRPD